MIKIEKKNQFIYINPALMLIEKAIKIKINNAKKGDSLKDKNIVQKIKIRNQINLYLLYVIF